VRNKIPPWGVALRRWPQAAVTEFRGSAAGQKLYTEFRSLMKRTGCDSPGLS